MLPWPISEIDIASYPPARSYPGAPPLCRLDATYAGAGCVRVSRELRRRGEELQFGRRVSALQAPLAARLRRPVWRRRCRGSLPEVCQEVRTGRFTSAPASVLVVACKSRIPAAGVTSSPPAPAARAVAPPLLPFGPTPPPPPAGPGDNRVACQLPR